MLVGECDVSVGGSTGYQPHHLRCLTVVSKYPRRTVVVAIRRATAHQSGRRPLDGPTTSQQGEAALTGGLEPSRSTSTAAHGRGTGATRQVSGKSRITLSNQDRVTCSGTLELVHLRDEAATDAARTITGREISASIVFAVRNVGRINCTTLVKIKGNEVGIPSVATKPLLRYSPVFVHGMPYFLWALVQLGYWTVRSRHTRRGRYWRC
jgi:hypothetical protein